MKHILKYPKMIYTIDCCDCWCIFECGNDDIKLVNYKDFPTKEYPHWEPKTTEGTQCPMCSCLIDLNGSKIYNVTN